MIDTRQCLSLFEKPNVDLSKWQETVDLMADLYQSDCATIVQFRENEFNVVVASNNPNNFLSSGDTWTWDMKSFCRHILETEQELYVSDAKDDQHWCTAIPVSKGAVQSYCGRPLYWPNGDLFGTICVIDTKITDYQSTLRRLLEQFSNLINSDLKALCDLSEIKSLVFEDDFTGLLNRRGLNLLGNQKLKDAPRYQQSIGLLYIDIDNLKQVNDAYGHVAGDNCIQILADVLKSECRDNDIVARIGGDEFIVLSLLHTRRELNQLAHRIEKDYLSLISDKDELAKSSLSTGLYISDCFSNISLADLINKGDQEMYTVKSAKK